jgi:WD40 repeat protein
MAVGSEDSSIQLWNLFPETSNSDRDIIDDRLNENPASSVGLGCRPKTSESMFVGHPSLNNFSGDIDRNNRVLRGHSGPVYGLAFIPGTKFLVSCSEDTTLRAWDYSTGVNRALYKGHTYPVWSVDCDRLGLNIATGKDSFKITSLS